jgi:hypothetical protein
MSTCKFGLAIVTCAAILFERLPSYANEKFDGWEFYSGKELHEWCGSPNPTNQETCASYVCGAVDAWAAESIVSHGKQLYSICLPTGTTCHEISNAVQEFPTHNPSAEKSGAGGLIGYALQQTYPCQKK